MTAMSPQKRSIGSPQSETLLRIYDKRLELQSKGRENWQEYGVRWGKFKKKAGKALRNTLAYFENREAQGCGTSPRISIFGKRRGTMTVGTHETPLVE